MDRVLIRGEKVSPARFSINKRGIYPQKGAYHGLQETPDGREICREEVLRCRLPDEYRGSGKLLSRQHQLHVWTAELISDSDIAGQNQIARQ